jgi:hypothetical protein
MNCLSWIVGHLASQEQYLWLELAQGTSVDPGLHARVGYGSPASTPPWEEMWDLWRAITTEADAYLVSLTPETLATHWIHIGDPYREDVGTCLLRNMYQY